MIKMASATVETICFEDEIPVILKTSLELETYIKVIMFTRKCGLHRWEKSSAY